MSNPNPNFDPENVLPEDVINKELEILDQANQNAYYDELTIKEQMDDDSDEEIEKAVDDEWHELQRSEQMDSWGHRI